MLNSQSLDRILKELPEKSVAVVGDLFLDKYLDLDADLTEESVETGLEAYQVVRTRCYPGAGGTVLSNLAALGVGKLLAVSVIGTDGEGFELIKALDAIDVDSTGVIRSDTRMTPTYSKPMLSQPGSPARELNRIDIKNRAPHDSGTDAQIITALGAAAEQVDALIVADQVTERNNGVITDAVRSHLAELAARHPEKVFFADSRAYIGLFRGVIAKPNDSELFAAVGVSSATSTTWESVTAAAKQLATVTGKPVYATLGAQGIIVTGGDEAAQVPAVPVTGPIDIVGAGDSTTAGIVSALVCGASPTEAAALGCLVASITIQQLGATGTATPTQLREAIAGGD